MGRERAKQINITWLAALGLLLVLSGNGCRRAPRAMQPPPPTVEAPQIDPWKAAAHKVEEDRGDIIAACHAGFRAQAR